MPTIKAIYDFLNTKAPFSLQEDWDNSGFLVGDPNTEVTKVLTALDITDEVIAEAAAWGAELIVSHHPVIFRPVRQATTGEADLTGRKVWNLARHGISAICCHTDLDVIEGGVNTVLAQKLGLEEIEQLEQTGTDREGRPCGIGRIGSLPQPMETQAFLRLVRSALAPNGIRYTDSGRPIRRVAVGGGACGDMVMTAWKAGCDAFVTSDVKYNQFLDAKELGMTLVDAGHFPTENPVIPVVAQWLRGAFPQVRVRISQRHREVISYDLGENSR